MEIKVSFTPEEIELIRTVQTKSFCEVCGEQATHTCPEASSLVCGTPLCDKKECRDNHRYI